MENHGFRDEETRTIFNSQHLRDLTTLPITSCKNVLTDDVIS